MKKIKFLMSLLAIVLAVGGAFATARSTMVKASSEVWYFIGQPGQENDRTKYQLEPVDGCGSGDALCSIVDVAFSNGIHPALSQGTVSTSNMAYQPEVRPED